MKETKEFLKAIKEDRFVEAHEILEHSWKRLKKLDKKEADIQKGLINGATALALFLRGKKEPSFRVWATFEKYRVLLDDLDSLEKDIYKECEKVLIEKYKKIMNKE